MFMFWFYTILAIVLYVAFGYVMLTATHKHMKDLERKVLSIDSGYVYGYAERMMNATVIHTRGSGKTDLRYLIGMIFWPVTCIYLIVKAEYEYGDIKKDIWKRNNELVR